MYIKNKIIKLYILCGLPFAGKTLFAKELAIEMSFSRIDLDDIKFELFGDQVRDENLTQKDWDEVFKEMYLRIEKLLSDEKVVVHDTGNFTFKERDKVRSIAEKFNLQSAVIWINTPASVARERLLNNNISKERFAVREEDFDKAVLEMEPPTIEENLLIYDGSMLLSEWIVENLGH